LHAAFVNFQESMVSLGPEKDSHPERLRAALLNGLVHYRNAIHRQITTGMAKERLMECRQAMALIQLVEIVIFRGMDSPQVLEGWLEESFPVDDDEDFWSLVFR
jgi:hypothetical protein